MSTVTVRAARRGDVAAIVDFQRAMARESEDKDLDRARVTRGVEAVFDAADGKDRGWYLVAEADGAARGVWYELRAPSEPIDKPPRGDAGIKPQPPSCKVTGRDPEGSHSDRRDEARRVRRRGVGWSFFSDPPEPPGGGRSRAQ